MEQVKVRGREAASGPRFRCELQYASELSSSSELKNRKGRMSSHRSTRSPRRRESRPKNVFYSPPTAAANSSMSSTTRNSQLPMLALRCIHLLAPSPRQLIPRAVRSPHLSRRQSWSTQTTTTTTAVSSILGHCDHFHDFLLSIITGLIPLRGSTLLLCCSKRVS